MPQRRILLSQANNTRELGGYGSPTGKTTRYCQFLRSDNVSACEDKDIGILKAYGLKTVIDLRSSDELQAHPSVFADCEGIAFHNIPLMASAGERDAPGFDFADTDTLIPLYKAILQNKSAMARLFSTMADAADGVTLFHCTAGKDRTGVTAMVLLMLADVPLLDIMADYQVTFTYILPLAAALRKKYPTMPQHVMQSDPAWIQAAYEFLIETYGSACSYLQFLGLSAPQILKLQKKLVE